MIRRNFSRVALVISMVAFALTCAGQSQLDTPKRHSMISGNIPELLRFVAQEYDVPVIAELVAPVSKRVLVPEGTDTATQILEQILNEKAGDRYEFVDDAILHVFNTKLLDSSVDFLNLRFSQFRMPASVSDLKLLLPARLNSLQYSKSGEVMSGFAEPDLENESLDPVTLQNVTAREVLYRAAREATNFFTVIIFPLGSSNPHAANNYAYRHWFWGSLHPSHANKPIWVQQPPQ